MVRRRRLNVIDVMIQYHEDKDEDEDEAIHLNHLICNSCSGVVLS